MYYVISSARRRKYFTEDADYRIHGYICNQETAHRYVKLKNQENNERQYFVMPYFDDDKLPENEINVDVELPTIEKWFCQFDYDIETKELKTWTDWVRPANDDETSKCTFKLFCDKRLWGHVIVPCFDYKQIEEAATNILSQFIAENKTILDSYKEYKNSLEHVADDGKLTAKQFVLWFRTLSEEDKNKVSPKPKYYNRVQGE